MKDGHSSRRTAQGLAAAAAAYQTAEVIPHCPQCAKPCCRLDALVLELAWKQVKFFWQVSESRAAFDRRLASGQGPEEIRAANGLYYAHRKACPAYDETARSCRVYAQAIKPSGCSDFPVYEDESRIVADLRCEAVSLDALKAWLGRELAPGERIVSVADKEFPFLVSLSVKSSAGRPRGRKGSGPPRR